ncbi:MAG: PilN domain-containing protein [Lautropia sp.]|nr:PilN domain-containing protein [Lautropia sp.]
MIRINLLPHREMRRERRKKDFVGTIAITAIAGGVLAFAGGFVINKQIEEQTARNNYVKTAIAKLDIEIAEIKDLEGAIAALQARQKAVEDLQSDRTIPVHLFDELVKLMPEGVFLERLQQVELMVTLNGFAQSNERVAELLRNLSDRSDWLEKPQLDEIKEVMVRESEKSAAAGQNDIRRAYEFKLNVLIKRRTPAGGPAAPGGRAVTSSAAGPVSLAAGFAPPGRMR